PPEIDPARRRQSSVREQSAFILIMIDGRSVQSKADNPSDTMNNNLRYEFGTKTVQDLCLAQSHGLLNLEPGFQRKSVWSRTDRRKLIQSVLEGMPVPSIFLYKREEEGRLIYDVLDGKQRLESLFMFCRVRPFLRQSFEVKHQFADDEAPGWYDWRS